MLAQLCEGEALDLAQNAQDSNSWEAWRAISKGFNPQGAGRKRSVTSQLLAPGSFDLKSLNSAIARWEEMLRVYERRAGKDLPDDVKATVLTEMTKRALKDHPVAQRVSVQGVRERPRGDPVIPGEREEPRGSANGRRSVQQERRQRRR